MVVRFLPVARWPIDGPTMLSRYKIRRGLDAKRHAVPDGVRQDTRKHTQHCLRPPGDLVETVLADPTTAAWERFASAYSTVLEERFQADRTPFDRLAELATGAKVLLGCNCPTDKQPDVRRCHTWLALEFMAQRYPELRVEFPGVAEESGS